MSDSQIAQTTLEHVYSIRNAAPNPHRLPIAILALARFSRAAALLFVVEAYQVSEPIAAKMLAELETHRMQYRRWMSQP